MDKINFEKQITPKEEFYSLEDKLIQKASSKGSPMLPVLVKLLQIPANAQAKIKVIDKRVKVLKLI